LCLLPYLTEMRYFVDRRRGIVEYKGQRVQLTPQLYRVFVRLTDQGTITHEEIFEEMHGCAMESGHGTGETRECMSRLRRALKGVLKIENYRGFGYSVLG